MIISLLKAHSTSPCLSDVRRGCNILVFWYFFLFSPPVVSDLLFSVGKYKKGFAETVLSLAMCFDD